MSRSLRVLYVFTARKQRLIESARRGEAPDTLLFGYNHLAPHGISARCYEPEYGLVGRQAAGLAGRLGPDFLQLRTLRQFTSHDVVFLTGGWPLLLAARAIPRARRPKLVWLNLTLTNLLRQGGRAAPLQRLAVRVADLTVCVARSQQRFLQQELGISLARLPLVLSGTDATFFDPSAVATCPAERAARIGRACGTAADEKVNHGQPLVSDSSDVPYVLAAGRDAGRDYGTLLAAGNPSGHPLRLVCSPHNLAGLPPATYAGVRYSVQYDLSPRDLRHEYAGASAVAIPTRGESSLNGSDCSGTLVLLDALAMHKPSVVSERTSVHDYVTSGEHALSVPPGRPPLLRAALERLLTDRTFAQGLAAAGRELVLQQLTTRHFAARLAALFHQVVA